MGMTPPQDPYGTSRVHITQVLMRRREIYLHSLNFHMLVDISSTKSDMLFPGGGEVVVASLHRLLKGLAIMVNGL